MSCTFTIPACLCHRQDIELEIEITSGDAIARRIGADAVDPLAVQGVARFVRDGVRHGGLQVQGYRSVRIGLDKVQVAVNVELS